MGFFNDIAKIASIPTKIAADIADSVVEAVVGEDEETEKKEKSNDRK